MKSAKIQQRLNCQTNKPAMQGISLLDFQKIIDRTLKMQYKPTLTAQSMESFVYGEMVEKMRKYHTLKGGKEPGYNPKLTAARVALAKTESEIEKLLDTLSGANPLLLQYANNRIEELDAERQKQLKLVADLTANSVSDTQIDCITNYLNDWESVSFDDKRKVVDILISHIDATSESVTIHWKI